MSPFGPLEELRARPIGDQAGARAARKGFRQRIAIARDNALFGEDVVEAHAAGLAGEMGQKVGVALVGKPCPVEGVLMNRVGDDAGHGAAER
jgi:hypothetical protein